VKLVETKEVGIRLTLSSGFTILVKPLPPYYLDFIDEQLPLQKHPNRKLKLASGETIDIEYLLPESVPEESNIEEYELYIAYKAAEARNVELDKLRDRMRSDFLISNCVRIIDGPIDFNSEDWVTRVEAAHPNYKVPVHPGRRLLAFMKSNVILHAEERSAIVETACFQEVNLQGIIDALCGFQSEMGREKST
jgi:hypothetical protein